MEPSFGYEPNTRKSSSGNDTSRDAYRVPSAFINVVPKLRNYEPATRIAWKKALVNMLKAIEATSLLKNTRRKVAADKPTSKVSWRALNAPFTPVAVEASYIEEPASSSGEESDGPDVQKVLWSTSTRAHSPHAHATYGLSPHDTYGSSSPRAPSSSHLALAGLGSKSRTRRAKPTLTQREFKIHSGLPPVPHSPPIRSPSELETDTPLFNRASTFLDRTPPESKYGSDSSHFATQRTYADSISSHRSHRSTSTKSSSKSGSSGASQSSLSSVTSGSSALTAGSLAHHTMESSPHYIAMSAQIESQAAQVESLTAMVKGLNKKITKTKISKTARTDYTEGASGVEPWVTEAILADDLKETHKWWHTKKQRWETPYETTIRHRVYQHLIEQVPEDMYSQNPHGDVRSIYINVVSMGTEEAAEQILNLEAELNASTKAGKPMRGWLTSLYTIYSQLSLLEHPQAASQIRLKIIQCLKHDQRYEHVIRDIKRCTSWTIVKIRAKLEAHASSINDLLEGPQHKLETKRIAKMAYQQAKEARDALESDHSDSDAAPEQLSRNQIRNIASRAKKKAAAAYKKAHPSPKTDKLANAERPKYTKEQLDILKQESCNAFRITGACKFGDSCHRSHTITPSATPDKLIHPAPEPEMREEQRCFNWVTNGSCAFGSNCRFAHITPKIGQVGKNHHRQAGTLGAPGDIVIITQSCPIPSLRGMAGQAHALNNDRLRIQLLAKGQEGLGHEAESQWTEMTDSIGLLATDYIICPPNKRLALMAGHKSRPRTGTGLYTLNAIFDSGSNTFMSFAHHLFTDLVKLDNPELIEGIDGYSEATHRPPSRC